ncbi:hypothetical protein BKA60DRAFT_602878 [Fusarium oxysporum]|nr:hypothetical protein BKA60DRAFT_602878 [Fusarium oxysporum]
MSFHLFPLLPLELRVQIWGIALRSAAMSVVSLSMDIMCPSRVGLSCASETVRQAGSYRIALSCKEALAEWERATSLSSEWASVRFCVSRTIFLLLDLVQLKSNSVSETLLFTGMISRIQHVAFFTESGINLIEVLTILTNLNHLEAIFIIVPQCPVKDMPSVDRHRIQSTAQFLANLTTESPPTTGCIVTEPVDLYLEGSFPDPKFEAFYTDVNAPSVELVMSRCSKDCQHDRKPAKWSVGCSLLDLMLFSFEEQNLRLDSFHRPR